MLLNLYLLWCRLRGIPHEEACSHFTIWRLRRSGVRIGRNCWISRHCRVESQAEIGNNCTLTNCTVLTHDASMWRHLGKTRTAKVVIRDNCYIGYGTIVLPGVTIGPDSIVGAGSVVTRDVPPRTVVAGVPARPLCDLDAFLVKHRLAMENKTMGYTD